jgi:lipopolysaccharide export LptBFGC system permease protein LptF
MGVRVAKEAAVAADQTLYTTSNGQVTTAELVNRAATQVSGLVREEIALAKAEMVAKSKRAGKGGGLLGAAGLLSLYGLGLLIALAVVALDLVLPLWLAVLTVAVVVFAIAATAAAIGRKQLRNAAPLSPTAAVAGVQADIDTIKHAVQEGRHT